jgi:Zn-dependent protease with chaperone function
MCIFLRFGLLAAVLGLVSGCATNTMTGRSQLMIVSENSAINKSTSMYTELMNAADKDGKLVTDEEVVNRVKHITDRLVERAVEYRPETKNWNWQVSIIKDDETVNAGCLPGGKMVLYSGLLEKVNPTDDELAQVMGHEISHALAKHGAEKMSVGVVGQIAAAAVVVAVAAADAKNPNASQRRKNLDHTAQLASLGAAVFITLPNSRQAETEADRMGVELAARAGYDPASAITLWEKMVEATGDKKNASSFLRTHPAPSNRIEALTALQEPMQAFYAEAKPLYTADYTPSVSYVRMNVWDTPQWVVVDEKQDEAKMTLAGSGAGRAFFSPQFDAFQKGTLELTCTNCSTGFFMKQAEFKRLYNEKDWRALQLKVADTNYKLDLSYLYLGFAAEGMGYSDASKAYFEQAKSLSDTEEFACAKGRMIKCQDFDVPAVSSEHLSH